MSISSWGSPGEAGNGKGAAGGERVRTSSATTSDLASPNASSGIGSTARWVRRISVALAAAALCLSILAVAPAAALTVRAVTSTFSGSGTNALAAPYGIAIDNSGGPSAGAVYVTDTTDRRVEKFDSAGNFLLMFGKEVNSGTGNPNVCTNAGPPTDVCQAGASGTSQAAFTAPAFIAVDNSSGPSAGDVYVGDFGTNLVQKFDSSGNLITSWGGTPHPGQLNGFGEGQIAGIAVDSSGNLAVNNTGTPMAIFRFAQDGTSLGNFTLCCRGTSPNGLAVDSSGYFYKAHGFPGVEKFNTTTDVGQVDDFSQATGIAIDSTSGDLYIDRGDQASRFHFTAVNQVSNDSGTCTFSPSEGCAPTESFGSGDLSEAKGIAVGATGKVYIANTGDGNVKVFTPVNVPAVTTGAPSNVTRTSATLSGHVDPDGGGDVTACHFEYGTTTSYSLGSASCTAPTAPPYSNPTDVSASLPSATLEPDTTYHFRLVAGNANGTGPAGADQTFKTPPSVAGVTTSAPTNVEKHAATATGSFTGDGVDTSYHFQYGPTTSYGQTTPDIDQGTGVGPQSVSADLTGLQVYTAYHYRLVAHNEYGTTVGFDQTFYTEPPDLPVVKRTFSSVVDQDSATVEAEVDLGDGLTVYRFEYGTTETYGLRTPPGGPLDPESAGRIASAELTDLAPGTLYHFRALVTNLAGTTVGPDETFVTPAAPVIATTAVSDVTMTSVVLKATINPQLSLTTFRFEYGGSASYGDGTAESAPIGPDNALHAVSGMLSNLTPGTVYHFRAVATNSIGTTYGVDQTFTTQEPAEEVPLEVKCRKGFVKRNGKCVRRKHRKHHRQHRSHK
jgi:hypothetical protein